MEFNLPYYVQNNGDGSVSTIFCASYSEAEHRSGVDNEGFAENTAGIARLRVENDKLYVSGYSDTFEPIWIEIEKE